MSIQEHHEKKGSIYQIKCAPTIAQMRHCQPHDCNVRSNRLETNPSLFYLFKSRAPRKKGSICQFKSTMKKGSICQIKSITKKRINMSNQEHHEKKDQYVKSRAP